MKMTTMTSLIASLDKTKLCDELKKEVYNVLIESGCENLVIKKFKVPALGLTVDSTIYINSDLLNSTPEIIVNILFHEAAHCHQFKKYGKEKMYEMFLKDMDHDEAASFIKAAEEVADEYSIRKVRKLKTANLLHKNFQPIGFHKTLPVSFIKLKFEDYKENLGKVNDVDDVMRFFINQL
jgi:hypothetical protein